MSILETVLEWGKQEIDKLSCKVDYYQKGIENRVTECFERVNEAKGLVGELRRDLIVANRDTRDQAEKLENSRREREREQKEWESEVSREMTLSARGSMKCQISELWERLMAAEQEIEALKKRRAK